MGNCFEMLPQLPLGEGDAASGAFDEATRERLRQLQEGHKFARTAYLGLSTQELHMNLSEDYATALWRTENTWTKSENGQLDLVHQVKSVKVAGEQGLQFLGQDNAVLMEVKAFTVPIRDQWLVSISDLKQRWAEHPEQQPKSSISAEGASNKAQYFKSREAEIQAREAANAERKAKYLRGGGMQQTAQIMANRS